MSVLEYYSSLLIRQYRNKPKAQGTIQLYANQSYCDGFLFDEKICFDIDTAVGKQLDIIGRIVGVPRNIYTLDRTHQYFNLIDYVDTPDPADTFGFGDYADSPYDPLGTLFFEYQFLHSGIYTLLDFEMRLLIKIKIILNNQYSSFKNIKELIYQFFPGVIDVVDNKNMTLTYNIATALTNVAEAMITLGLLPKPMGVGLIINYV